MPSPSFTSTRGHGSDAPSSADSNRLTAQDLVAYERDGFVVPRFRFSKSEISRLRDLCLKLVADNPKYADYLMQSPHVPGNGVQGLKTTPGWMEFAAHPLVLDMIEQIMGPDIILRGTAAFYKRTGTGPATAWHRDASNLPITPLRSTHVWIAASDCYIENACLRFLPGSHMEKKAGNHIIREFEYRQPDGSVGPALVKGEYDDRNAVDLEMEAGQIVIFDVFTAHASRPNLGTRERVSYALRYMPATSRYDHDSVSPELSTKGYSHHMRPLMLLRGVNHAGNDLKRGHPGQVSS
jgi:chlorinating enzyme